MLGKKICLVVTAAILFSGIPGSAKTTLPDVVAVVNGEKIGNKELTAMLIDWQAPVVLDELIGCRVIGQAARKAGIVVTVDQVKAKIEEIKEGLPPGQDFEEMLMRNRLTPGHFFAIVKMQLQAELVVRKSIKVTAKDFEAYRRASHILVRIPYTEKLDEKPKNEQEAKEKAESIAEEIKAGLAFEEAAEKYSEDLQTKGIGGDLGFLTTERVAPEFATVVFAMKAGEISEPVTTPYGYHIIKLTAIGKDTKGEEREELKETIVKTRLGERYREWMLSTRNQADVQNMLVPEIPQPEPARSTRPTPPGPPPGEGPPPPPEAEIGEQPEELPPPPPSDEAPTTTSPAPADATSEAEQSN